MAKSRTRRHPRLARSQRSVPDTSDTLRRIADSAATLVAQAGGGVDEVKVSDIAEQARVTPATVHLHFGSAAKEHILVFIYRQFVALTVELMDHGRYFLQDGGPVQQLMAILSATLRSFERGRSYGRVVLKEMRDVNPSREWTKPIYDVFDRVDTIIAEGQRRGEIVKQFPPSSIRKAIFDYTRSWLEQKYSISSPVSDLTVSDDMVKT
jgi:AcrR family transcriptional regulator